MPSSRWIAALLVSLLIETSAPSSWAQETSHVTEAPGPGATAAAVLSNAFYVPGKAIVCGVSGGLWVAAMVLTFGSLYQEAADFVKGSCGGQWVLTGEDMRPAKSY